MKRKKGKIKKKKKRIIKNLIKLPNIMKIISFFCLLYLIFSTNYDLYKNKNNKNKNLRRYKKYKQESINNAKCNLLDPINIFELRIRNGPIEICNNTITRHICYINHEGYYNSIFVNKYGVLCIMENIVLDPSKLILTKFIYKGPVDPWNKGFPKLINGFLNTKCIPNDINFQYNQQMYDSYFNSWNYDYNIENGNGQFEELSPGKTILLIGRNEDSPNLFHGTSEIINIICILYLFNLSPEEVQIVIFSGIEIQITEDPFYEIYKNIFSGGNDPIYIKNLKKKYKISKAINVPINWDSPPFIDENFTNCESATKTYKIFNNFVDKYIDIKPFKDSFISDNITFYYPDIIIKNHEKDISFSKKITIQWRKVWPKGRKGQTRLLGNAEQLTNKLIEVLPKNILVRLIDTASLQYKDQISVIRDTDYLIGIHGAGLSLSIFLPKNAILHEINQAKNNNFLTLMSSLSGHKTYSDLLKSESFKENENEYILFDENDFIEKVLAHMKENNFFD